MCKVGWIVVADDSLSLHNFDRHNGETAKQRAQTAKRVAKHRSNADSNGTSNAVGVTSALAREEKRREEKKTPKAPKGADVEGFASFWQEYPNHAAKANALKAWGKVPAELHSEIVAAVKVQAASPAWTKDGGQFVPHAATWLNGKRWEDEASNDSKTELAGSFL
jgi:hypothetical protein